LNVYERLQSSSKLDKVYGPHSLRNGNVILGINELKFIENEIHIYDTTSGIVSYPLTSGLVNLLIDKIPKAYTTHDLHTYKQILIQTSAHRTKNGSSIKISTGKNMI